MKPLLYIGLLAALVAPAANASLVAVEQWYMGDSNCTIDGRFARMNWKVTSHWVGHCDGDVCSGYESADLVGKFSDNGSAWVPLARRGSAPNILYIRYQGAEPDNWMLKYAPTTHKATGWTTWRGKHYPLVCWKNP